MLGKLNIFRIPMDVILIAWMNNILKGYKPDDILRDHLVRFVMYQALQYTQSCTTHALSAICTKLHSCAGSWRKESDLLVLKTISMTCNISTLRLRGSTRNLGGLDNVRTLAGFIF